QGDAPVVVGKQGLVDQLFQHRIAEAAPELQVHRGRGFPCDLRRCPAGELVDRRQRRTPVVGTDRACRQQHAGDGYRESTHHHGSTSPRCTNVPVGPVSSSSAICTLDLAPVTMSSSPLLFMSVFTEPGWIALTL